MISEAWAGLAGVTIYVLFRLGAYLTQYITDVLPLDDTAPAKFLESVLSWGAALSAAATFVVITIYQLLVLLRRLWESL